MPTSLTDRNMIDAARRLARLAEWGPGDNSGHIERVRAYSQVIGMGMDLSASEAEAIGYASMLHDVGMAGLPEAIKMKRGELSSLEWETMKRHPLLGSEMLQGSPSAIFQLGEIIALTHHERWDGSGYPYGLSGEDIPLSGRICALADVFDALTSPRPYKEEISLDCALDLIKDAKGQLFDPQVVHAFLDKLDDIRKFMLVQRVV
jgi:putative two-component system response regulator